MEYLIDQSYVELSLVLFGEVHRPSAVGGGAYLDDSDLWGDHSYIYHNRADDDGGGVYATNSSLLDMDLGAYACAGPRCSQLSDNTATTGYGGGAYALDDSEIDLRQTFVENNQANLGGGLYASQSPLYLDNTLLARNNATGSAGDGLRLYTGATLTGMYNTFAHNDAGGAATGRAIDLFSATLDLQISVIWGHASSLSDAAQTVTCSDIQGGYAGSGNINADPLFIDPSAANFHLQHTSPAIDQCAAAYQTYDFDNELRPIIYARPATPYDMGADEASARVGINGSACVVWIASDRVAWEFALPMMGAAIVGGFMGAHWAQKIPAWIVRWMVIAIGFSLAGFYFLKRM